MNPHEWKTDFWKTYNLVYRKVIAYATNENHSRTLKDIFGLFDRTSYAHIVLRGSTNVVGAAIINLTNAVTEDEEKVLLTNCDLVITTDAYLANALVAKDRKVLFLAEGEHSDAFSLFYRVREILEFNKYRVPDLTIKPPKTPLPTTPDLPEPPKTVNLDIKSEVAEPKPVVLSSEAKIGIVMPLYNQERFVGKTIESLLNQKYADWNLYIINDGSEDNSRKVVDGYKDKRILCVNHLKNAGIAAALNTGFKLATEPYLTWISSDNIYYQDYLQSLLTIFTTTKNLSFVYSDYDVLNEDGNRIRTVMSPPYSRQSLADSYQMGICFLFTKQIKAAAGEYKDGFAQDYEMAVRMSKLGQFYHLSEVLGGFRQHKEQASNKDVAPDTNKVKEMAKKLIRR